MAMFEFKESEDITIKDCSTKSDKFFSGEKIKGFEAVNCQAKGKLPETQVVKEASLARNIGNWFVEHAIAAICAAVVALALAFFQLTKT